MRAVLSSLGLALGLGLGLALAACGGAAGSHTATTPAKPTAPPPPVAPPASPPTLASWDQLHGPIRSFSITGGEDVDYLRMQPLLNDEVGKPLDRARLRAKLDGALAAQTLANVEVSGEQLADGIRLVVRLTARPNVISVVVKDPAGLALPLSSGLSAAVGARLAPPVLDAAVSALIDDYAASGNVAATVEWTTTPATGGVAVTIAVDPGEALVIAGRTYDGAKLVKAAELDRLLAHDLPLNTPWIQDKVDRAVLLLVAYYWDHGFAEVAIRAAPPPVHPPATVVFQVHEGPVYHLGMVDVSGVPPADAKRFRALMPRVKTGALFSRTDIANGRDAVAAALVHEGHPRALVSPVTRVDPTKHLVGLSFEIDLGPAGP